MASTAAKSFGQQLLKPETAKKLFLISLYAVFRQFPDEFGLVRGPSSYFSTSDGSSYALTKEADILVYLVLLIVTRRRMQEGLFMAQLTFLGLTLASSLKAFAWYSLVLLVASMAPEPLTAAQEGIQEVGPVEAFEMTGGANAHKRKATPSLSASPYYDGKTIIYCGTGTVEPLWTAFSSAFKGEKNTNVCFINFRRFPAVAEQLGVEQSLLTADVPCVLLFEGRASAPVRKYMLEQGVEPTPQLLRQKILGLSA